MARLSDDARFDADPEYRDDMLIGALVHDLGKSLSLFGEADGNVDCMNRVTNFTAGGGLDGLEFQYNHDQFGHDKLRANVRSGLMKLPPRVLDIVRLHSLREMGALSEAVARAAAARSSAAHAQASSASRARAASAAMLLLAGEIVSEPERKAFREQISDPHDLTRAGFVLHFAEYDLHSKDRTNEIPAVDVGEIKRLLRKYITDGLTIAW